MKLYTLNGSRLNLMCNVFVFVLQRSDQHSLIQVCAKTWVITSPKQHHKSLKCCLLLFESSSMLKIISIRHSLLRPGEQHQRLCCCWMMRHQRRGITSAFASTQTIAASDFNLAHSERFCPCVTPQTRSVLAITYSDSPYIPTGDKEMAAAAPTRWCDGSPPRSRLHGVPHFPSRKIRTASRSKWKNSSIKRTLQRLWSVWIKTLSRLSTLIRSPQGAQSPALCSPKHTLFPPK